MNLFNQKGSALIELVISLPLLVVVLYGTVEVGTIIQKQQTLATFTLELGDEVYRSCSASADSTAALNCIENATKDIVSSSELRGIAGVKYAIKLWGVNEVGGAKTLPSLISTYESTPNPSSKVNEVFIFSLKSYDRNLRKSLVTLELELEVTLFGKTLTLYDECIF